ncbi:MAG TPA: DUF1592 domain-containing protein [Pseudomonadota bacterium]|nr:DUF1592 domain-containing protein [Pseudomonadota bacterium]
MPVLPPKTRLGIRPATLLFALGLGVLPACSSDGEPPPAEVAPPGPLTPPPRRLRRLSQREYKNVVRDLLGETMPPTERFVPDTYQNGYDNGSAELAVQTDQLEAYQDAAEVIAERAVRDRLSRLLAGCDRTTAGDTACLESFLQGFAARAFRRPLSDGERERLRTAYASEHAAPEPFLRGLQTVLEVILQSPQFLYREELGAPDAERGATTVTLSDYELASELSFLITGSLPDDALWSAVQGGRFHRPEDHLQQAVRLLAQPGARPTLRAFLHKWLATDRVPTLSKAASVYPRFSTRLAASMAGELDRFYDEVLWRGRGSLQALFTENTSFVDADLAALYGVPHSGEDFARVQLPAEQRAGVLTRAGFLSVHSASDSSGPVSRGVFLLHALLCLPPPQPPANVPPAIPVGDPRGANLTTRQRFAQHVADPACAGCHTRIDGVGFGFEEFDGIGAYRTTENGQPVDTRGTLMGTFEIDGDYVGVSELSRRLADSQLLARCFLRQSYRYAMGQIEPDGDDLASLGASFSSQSALREALLLIVKSPLFSLRTVEPSAQ